MADDVIAGRYRLLEPLGRGAMSAVWLAEDAELGRRVALKTLAPNADRARFEREAHAAAALAHPNICALYDYGETEGRPYMVLEYLPNGSLEERLASGSPLADTDTHRIAAEVAAGLAHAHERGLVHRDLKPANVLFDAEGRAKIADFGIARMSGTGTLTEAGTVLGTASYISPEQASGIDATPASDVYSFGAILFRMLTGRLPFVSANAMELVRMHRDDPPPPVSAFRDDAPPRLAALAEASLAKEPAARPADGSALVDRLRGGEPRTMLMAPVAAGAAAAAAAGAGTAYAAETEVLRPQPAAGRRRRAFPLAAIAIAGLLIAAGAAVAYVASRGGGGSGSPAGSPSTPLTLPSVSALTRGTKSTTAATTPTTAPASTTAPTTTAQTTTHRTTTHRTTTQPATTAPTTTQQTTTTITPPPPATTAPPPPTTTALTTTTTATTTTAATTTTPVP